MKTAIFGAGSLGTVLGAYITKSGADVTLVNRNREHVDALNKNGARVTGRAEMLERVRAVTPEEMGTGYDVIILMTKQSGNRDTANFLAPRLSEGGVLCTAQNGLPEPPLIEILGAERVAGCAVSWGATLKAPGISELTSEPDSMSFQIGYTGDKKDSARLRNIKEVLGRMCPVYIEENFIGARWSKLLINAAFSGLSAVCGASFGEIAGEKRTRAAAQRVIKECIDTAKAAGITLVPVQGKDIAKLMDYRGPIKKKIAEWLIPVAIRKHRFIRSGMLRDIENGRKTEVDAINGAVRLCALKHGRETPFNDRIIEIIHEIEEGKRTPSAENIRLFGDLL